MINWNALMQTSVTLFASDTYKENLFDFNVFPTHDKTDQITVFHIPVVNH